MKGTHSNQGKVLTPLLKAVQHNYWFCFPRPCGKGAKQGRMIAHRSGEAVIQESLGRSPTSVNLNFWELPTPKGQKDSARGFNPGIANTTAIRPVGALDLT